MDKVTVNRQVLLTKIKENRDKHRAIFLEAQTNYRKFLIEELDKMLTEARDGVKFGRSVQLTEPVDHTKDYDVAINMLEMSLDEELEISHGDFKCFVMDDWHWKRNFLVSNSTYSTTACSGLADYDNGQ